MMRNQAGPPPMATPLSRAYGHTLPPSSGYRRLNTPIKFDPSPAHAQTAPVSATSSANKRPPPSSESKVGRDPKIPRSTGKENVVVQTPKRSPCNCKKSKCLKLYCECFAAELFCDGCNCADCQNTSAYVSFFGILNWKFVNIIGLSD